MSRKFTTMAAAAVLGLATVATVPMGPNSAAEAQRRGSSTRTADLSFVAQAGASDMYEIESSRLALRRSQRADVREFAQMMIDHHMGTTRDVAAAARRDGLMPPPPRMTPAQRNMIRQLERARGANFDRTYLTQQTSAHQQALTLHRNRARMNRGVLSQAAATAVPIVQQHLERVRMMSRRR